MTKRARTIMLVLIPLLTLASAIVIAALERENQTTLGALSALVLFWISGFSFGRWSLSSGRRKTSGDLSMTDSSRPRFYAGKARPGGAA